MTLSLNRSLRNISNILREFRCDILDNTTSPELELKSLYSTSSIPLINSPP